MHIKLGVMTALLSLTVAANAKPSLAPSVATPEEADKTIVIKESTKHVNVFENETILFMSNGQQFAVKFDGLNVGYDLGSIAPAGAVTHKVRVYVSPNPKEPQEGKP